MRAGNLDSRIVHGASRAIRDSSMTLRTRLTISLNGLLLVTVALVSGLTLFTTVHSLREDARHNALSTASLLARAATVSIGAPGEIENLIGDQMVVQARLAAHLVKIAEGKAGLSPQEINAVLDDVTRNTVLDEFWITDPQGKAYLRSTEARMAEDFQFLPDPELQPQSHEFYKLLADKTGAAVVVQEARRREMDDRPYKFVGVSGLDKPRIVQVGYNADFITRLCSKFAVQQLVENVVDAGNLEAVFVVDAEKALDSPKSDELVKDYYYNKLDVMASETMRTLRPAVQFRGNAVEACVPLPGFGGRTGALICRLSTRELDRAVSSSLRDIIVLSIAGLIAGGLVSGVLAKRISGPIQKLAEATSVVGTGGFHHRVKVDSRDEVGMLAASFNKMTDSLETYTEELARTMSEKKAMARELDIASEIQRSLLPESCPRIDNFDIAAVSIPAREVGGDFYDFIPLPEGKWGVVIADVSGKGVPAALLMALSRSLIRAYSQDRPSVLSALELANSFMLKDMRSGMFVTCFYAVLDPAQRTLTYVNAGHNPPVVTSAGKHVRMLSASGTPLGIIEETGLREELCQLAPGDIVMMYTDGITEAMDSVGEQFGVQRLQEIARNATGLSAADIQERVLTAVRTFTVNQPQFDDMTSVVVRAT